MIKRIFLQGFKFFFCIIMKMKFGMKFIGREGEVKIIKVI